MNASVAIQSLPAAADDEELIRIVDEAVSYTHLPGCMLAPQMIWELSDVLNGMMAIPNLIALFFLGKQVQYGKRKT